MKLHIFIFSPIDHGYESPVCDCGHGFRHPIHIQNGGEICDAWGLPCACGSWHNRDYVDETNRRFMDRVSNPNYVPNELETEVIRLMAEDK